MYYSLIGIVGLTILLLTNYDILLNFKNNNTKLVGSYRLFFLAISCFYIVDILWGVLWYLGLQIPLFIETEFYFTSMVITVLAFAKYTVDYLEKKSITSKAIIWICIAFVIFAVSVIIINNFVPIMYKVDEDCNFISCKARYVVLGLQVIVLAFISIYAFFGIRKGEGLITRKYLTIGLFGIIMVVCISLQLCYPLLPLYTIGYIIGTATLRTFVIDNEKEEYRIELENSLEREQEQFQELKQAWDLAYTDSLTGVGSKLSYLELQDKYDELIRKKELNKLAIAVFDINNLKMINDTYGHQAGDKYIIDACELIKNTFKNSKVYRIGGDEFFVLIDDEDYQKKENLEKNFKKQIEDNVKSHNVIVAIGLTEYNPNEDYAFGCVVNRADGLMYEQKKKLKELNNDI